MQMIEIMTVDLSSDDSIYRSKLIVDVSRIATRLR